MNNGFLDSILKENRLEVDQLHSNRNLIRQLIALRKKRGLSQAEVASRMGCDKSWVSKIESPNIELNLTQDTIGDYLAAVRGFLTYSVVPEEDRGDTSLETILNHRIS